MLESRLVHTSFTGRSLTAKVVGGCLQGEVLSPLLWNPVFDRLLAVTNDIGLVHLPMLTILLRQSRVNLHSLSGRLGKKP